MYLEGFVIQPVFIILVSKLVGSGDCQFDLLLILRLVQPCLRLAAFANQEGEILRLHAALALVTQAQVAVDGVFDLIFLADRWVALRLFVQGAHLRRVGIGGGSLPGKAIEWQHKK